MINCKYCSLSHPHTHSPKFLIASADVFHGRAEFKMADSSGRVMTFSIIANPDKTLTFVRDPLFPEMELTYYEVPND